jgi:hypothetical protein
MRSLNECCLPPDLRVYLEDHGATDTLIEAYSHASSNVALRIIIADDSGSTNKFDGCSQGSPQDPKYTAKCSRWKEIWDETNTIVQLSHAIGVKTVVGTINQGILSTDATKFAGLLPGFFNPRGQTPLLKMVEWLKPFMEGVHAHAVVSLVLITDGIPSDGSAQDLARALITLGPNLHVVFRLCTDDEDVIEEYNELMEDEDEDEDKHETIFTVLDDWRAEAHEVYNAGNTEFVYSYALHLLRVLGGNVPMYIQHMDSETIPIEAIQAVIGKDQQATYCPVTKTVRKSWVPKEPSNWSFVLYTLFIVVMVIYCTDEGKAMVDSHTTLCIAYIQKVYPQLEEFVRDALTDLA